MSEYYTSDTSACSLFAEQMSATKRYDGLILYGICSVFAHRKLTPKFCAHTVLQLCIISRTAREPYDIFIHSIPNNSTTLYYCAIILTSTSHTSSRKSVFAGKTGLIGRATSSRRASTLVHSTHKTYTLAHEKHTTKSVQFIHEMCAVDDSRGARARLVGGGVVVVFDVVAHGFTVRAENARAPHCIATYVYTRCGVGAHNFPASHLPHCSSSR